MCGIAGYVGLDNQAPLNPEVLVRMSESLSHRGPDGEGFYFGGVFQEHVLESIRSTRPKSTLNFNKGGRTLSLVHRRLSIIDLSDLASQPMCDFESKIWIVFNGEIYNHKEVRETLLKKGYIFKTDHSDTETIIYAYKEWGKEFIYKLRGMFAFVIWDSQKDTLLLYRDRTGIKPLYYCIANGRFYFASEIKAILQDDTIRREMNEKGLYNYLSFLTVPAPETLFKNIYKLSAGHYIEVVNGNVSEQREYWDVFDNVSVMYDKTEDEIRERLLYELRDSVACHLEADVPVGIFLSGGIDSSTNAALFKEIAKTNVKAFSIGYKEDYKLKSYKNEFYYSRKVAKELGLEYYELELSQEDLINFLPKLIYHQDEPIADPVCVPIYYVSKLARENGVIVAQVGEGSDELFWGYTLWKKLLMLQNLNDLPVPQLFKKALLKMLKCLGKKDTNYYEYLRRGAYGERVFWSGAESFFEENKKAMLSKRLKEGFKDYSSWEIIEKYNKKFLKSAPEPSNLNWMSYIDLKIRLPELLLMRVDKMAMAVSLEGRVPFLDYKFVEFAMSIPSALKTKNNESKYILKKAVEGLIPHEIIYRKKQGFGAPVYDWFLDKLGQLAKEKISSFNKETDVFDKAFINKLYEQKKGDKVWYLLNLAAWWENYIGHH
jgi:asparagine synthase (glutamine-hydrolysing)